MPSDNKFVEFLNPKNLFKKTAETNIDLIESTIKEHHDIWKNEQKSLQESPLEEKVNLLQKQQSSLLNLLQTHNIPPELHNNYPLPIFYNSFKGILKNKILIDKKDDKNVTIITLPDLTTKGDVTSMLPNTSHQDKLEIMENINKNIGNVIQINDYSKQKVVNDNNILDNTNTKIISIDNDEESGVSKNETNKINKLIEKFDEYVDDKVIPYCYGYDDIM
uniref:Transcription initiation factor TFIID subunit 8 n=1 Tax=Strongyloides venezuelensis TaxID=75913 RepID=A0A0K0FJE6_STRVS